MDEWDKQHKTASSDDSDGVQEEAEDVVINSESLANPCAKLQMTIIKGQQLRDAQDFFGKMNPFVIVEVNGKKYRTQVQYDEHSNPVWNKTINFPVLSMGDTVLISCVNADKFGQPKSVIGEAEVPMYTLCRQGGIKDWFGLNYKGKHAGTILLDTAYTPPPEKPETI